MQVTHWRQERQCAWKGMDDKAPQCECRFMPDSSTHRYCNNHGSAGLAKTRLEYDRARSARLRKARKK